MRNPSRYRTCSSTTDVDADRMQCSRRPLAAACFLLFAASAEMACNAARRVAGMSAEDEMILASSGRTALGSRKARLSSGARSPPCSPTQAAFAKGATAPVSARSQPRRQTIRGRARALLVRITSRSLRATVQARSALFYGFLFLCGRSAGQRHSEETEGLALVQVHGDHHAQLGGRTVGGRER